jgi:hypothetical protein
MPCHYAVVFWAFCSVGLCEPPNFAFLFVPVIFSFVLKILILYFSYYFLIKNSIVLEALDWGKQDAEKIKHPTVVVLAESKCMRYEILLLWGA